MSTNQPKRAEEVATVELMVALLVSAQSTLKEEDYIQLDAALTRARGMREAQSKKSRIMKYAYSIGMDDNDMKELINEL
jgi:hypothetical protein